MLSLEEEEMNNNTGTLEMFDPTAREVTNIWCLCIMLGMDYQKVNLLKITTLFTWPAKQQVGLGETPKFLSEDFKRIFRISTR